MKPFHSLKLVPFMITSMTYKYLNSIQNFVNIGTYTFQISQGLSAV